MPLPLMMMAKLQWGEYATSIYASNFKRTDMSHILVPPSRFLLKRIKILINEGEGFNKCNYAIYIDGLPQVETAAYMGWQAKVTTLLMDHYGKKSYSWKKGIEAKKFDIIASSSNFDPYHECKLSALHIALEEATMKQGVPLKETPKNRNTSSLPNPTQIKRAIKDHSKRTSKNIIPVLFPPPNFSSRSQNENYAYDVTLSFAGEDRTYVDQITKYLKEYNLKYFYDKDEEVTLWGKDLYVYLDDIYRNKSQFCVVFISKHYKEKRWTNHEIKSAQARAFDERKEYILPVRLDDTEISGILPTVGYLDGRKYDPLDIAKLILEKILHSKNLD